MPTILLSALTLSATAIGKILDYRIKWLNLLTPEQRAQVLARDVDNLQFLHDLFAPIRNLVDRIAEAQKEPESK